MSDKEPQVYWGTIAWSATCGTMLNQDAIEEAKAEIAVTRVKAMSKYERFKMAIKFYKQHRRSLYKELRKHEG